MRIQRITLAVILWCSYAVAAEAKTVHVVDGDTLDVDGIRYRLHGIDAPEAAQSCKSKTGKTWKCGKAAISELEQLVLKSQSVECDNRGVDEFGRIIAICLADGVNVNEMMIKAGLAWSYRKFSHDFDKLEDEVHNTNQGIWQAATQTPWDFRHERWEVAKQIAPEGCPIKGNISENGHIYHTPWSPWYDRTSVNEAKGERWFCDEAQALKAGWRAPYWGR
jgi:endonuclease YncB( thermonuclease family)